jgi:hypothetical protein
MTYEDDEPLSKRDALIDLVSEETGASTKAVKRVIDILIELQDDEAELYLVDGEIAIDWINTVSFDGEPDELWISDKVLRRIEALDDFDGELIEPIKAGWQKVYGWPYPTIAVLRFASA